MSNVDVMAAIQFAGLSATDTAKYQFIAAFMQLIEESSFHEVQREIEEVIANGKATKGFKKWKKAYEAKA